MNDDAELNLRELSVPTLIKVIFADVKSGADFYRETPAHELAELLGIDDADNPGTGRDWQFIRYVCREPLAEHINGGAGSEILDCLEANVNPERLTVIRELGKTLDETYSLDLSRLRKREIRLIEDAIATHELHQIDGGWVIARTSIEGPCRHWLQFEALIEDDGACINLMTAYDERDGKFTDLAECVTEEW
jgi:hypothetical protein